MTKQSHLVLAENPATEILNENSSVIGNVDGTVFPKKVAVADKAPSVKKKTASRKKASGVADSAEAKAKKTTTQRSRSTKMDSAEASPSTPVMKAFWGVFNPMMVQVAQYSYADEAEARKAASDMTEKKKAPHFVQLIKKVI